MQFPHSSGMEDQLGKLYQKKSNPPASSRCSLQPAHVVNREEAARRIALNCMVPLTPVQDIPDVAAGSSLSSPVRLAVYWGLDVDLRYPAP